jgi:serine/threonine-protein kinase HipA
MIADVWGVVREWKVRFEGFGVARAKIDKAVLAFRHIDDISTPALRKLLSQQLPEQGC